MDRRGALKINLLAKLGAGGAQVVVQIRASSMHSGPTFGQTLAPDFFGTLHGGRPVDLLQVSNRVDPKTLRPNSDASSANMLATTFPTLERTRSISWRTRARNQPIWGDIGHCWREFTECRAISGAISSILVQRHFWRDSHQFRRGWRREGTHTLPPSTISVPRPGQIAAPGQQSRRRLAGLQALGFLWRPCGRLHGRI